MFPTTNIQHQKAVVKSLSTLALIYVENTILIYYTTFHQSNPHTVYDVNYEEMIQMISYRNLRNEVNTQNRIYNISQKC